MNPKLKRFLIIFVIAVVVHFPLFYVLEEDGSCIFEWGSRCSTSFFVRTGFQSIFMTVFLFYFSRNKKVDKQ